MINQNMCRTSDFMSTVISRLCEFSTSKRKFNNKETIHSPNEYIRMKPTNQYTSRTSDFMDT